MPDRGNADRPGAVLLIEDDADVRRFIHERLTAQGFVVSEAPSGERGLELFNGQRFDVVLLDVHLPGVDGFSVLRSIRRTSEVPVLLLTAATDEADRVLGLEIGADDYITKPFLPRELVARIRAVLRRVRPADHSAVMHFDQLVIDPSAREVLAHGELVKLTDASSTCWRSWPRRRGVPSLASSCCNRCGTPNRAGRTLPPSPNTSIGSGVASKPTLQRLGSWSPCAAPAIDSIPERR